MNTGLGNAGVRSSKVPQPTPATVTAANNGTSLSGTTVQLGQLPGAVGDPAILINDRVIPLGGHEFSMIDAGSNRHFLVFADAANGRYILGDIDEVNEHGYVDIDGPFATLSGPRSAIMGDVTNDFGGSQIATVGNAGGQQRIVAAMAGNEYLHLSLWQDVYMIGDINNASNGVLLELDNLNRNAYFGTGQGNATYVSIDDLNEVVYAGSASGTNPGGGIRLDGFLGLYRIGDGGINNGTFLEIDDPNQTAIIESGGDPYLSIDAVLKQFQLGDFTGAGNGAAILIDDNPQQFQFFDNLGLYLYIDPTTGFYELGDLSSAYNGTGFHIDDAAQLITMSSGGNDNFFLDVANRNLYMMVGDPAFVLDEAEMSISGNIIGFYAQTALPGQTISAQFSAGAQQFQVTTANGIKIIGDAAFLIHTGTVLTDGAGAAAGTLTNAPTAGDPAKWIAIDDNGTTRYIPTWI